MKKERYGHLQNAMDEIESWSYEEAQKLGREWHKKHGVQEWSPLIQWSIWNNWLPKFEKKWNDGDSKALIEALALCSKHGLPIPEWCGLALNKASEKLQSLEARNWSDVLPEPFKGRRMHDLRREAKIKEPAVREALRLRERPDPIPVVEALELVSQKYAVSMEKLRQWYYEFLKIFPDASVPTSQGEYRFKSGEPLPEDAKVKWISRWNEEEK